jgi:basic membrane protein A and related proteins
MLDQNVRDAYDNARKKAKFRYTANISKGWTGILPSLNGIVKNTDIISEISLGLVEVPLKKIIGTYSHSRSTSFADNFMPLPTRGSEFSSKWCTLYKAHLEEGIRDPIRVYEYLNWYYVIEGNKRVSVLKYVDAVSISAEVRRLLPRKDDSD